MKICIKRAEYRIYLFNDNSSSVMLFQSRVLYWNFHYLGVGISNLKISTFCWLIAKSCDLTLQKLDGFFFCYFWYIFGLYTKSVWLKILIKPLSIRYGWLFDWGVIWLKWYSSWKSQMHNCCYSACCLCTLSDAPLIVDCWLLFAVFTRQRQCRNESESVFTRTTYSIGFEWRMRGGDIWRHTQTTCN